MDAGAPLRHEGANGTACIGCLCVGGESDFAAEDVTWNSVITSGLRIEDDSIGSLPLAVTVPSHAATEFGTRTERSVGASALHIPPHRNQRTKQLGFTVRSLVTCQ